MRSIFLAGMVLGGLALVLPARAAEEKATKPKRPLTSHSDELGGRNFDDWLRDLKTSHDPAVVENAIRTILLYDPRLAQEAVPAVIERLRYQETLDVSIKVSMAIFLSQIDLGSEYRSRGVEKLIAMLKSTRQVIVQYYAILALARLGENARAAIPTLKVMLGDSSWDIRKLAAQALAGIALPKQNKFVDKDIIDRLRARLAGDTCFIVRLEIARTMVILGPPSKTEDRKSLLQALQKVAARARENESVRIWAHVATLRMATQEDDKETARTVAFVGKQLDSPTLMVRIEAARALGTMKVMNVDIRAQLKRLVGALGDKEALMVDAAIAALAQVGKQAVPLLADELTSQKLLVRCAAARTLGAIGLPDAETQVQPLIKALADREPAMVESAAGALAQMGSQVADSVGQQLANPNPKVRYAAVGVLALMGPGAKTQVGRLRATLTDVDQNLVQLAMAALASIGRGAEPAIPDLRQLAQAKPDLKEAINRVIGAIRRPSPE